MRAPKCRTCGKEHWGTICNNFASEPRREAPAPVASIRPTNPRSPSKRDASAHDKASSVAAPQGKATLVGTDSETPADHEGHAAPSGASSGSDVEAVTPPKFDRAAYQREYMRKRRAEKKK